MARYFLQVCRGRWVTLGSRYFWGNESKQRLASSTNSKYGNTNKSIVFSHITHVMGRSPRLAVQATLVRPPSWRPDLKRKGSMRGATAKAKRGRGRKEGER